MQGHVEGQEEEGIPPPWGPAHPSPWRPGTPAGRSSGARPRRPASPPVPCGSPTASAPQKGPPISAGPESLTRTAHTPEAPAHTQGIQPVRPPRLPGCLGCARARRGTWHGSVGLQDTGVHTPRQQVSPKVQQLKSRRVILKTPEGYAIMWRDRQPAKCSPPAHPDSTPLPQRRRGPP